MTVVKFFVQIEICSLQGRLFLAFANPVGENPDNDEEGKNGEKGSTENPHGLVVVGRRELFGCLGGNLQALDVNLTVFFRAK